MSPTRPFGRRSRGEREPFDDPRNAGQEPELVEARDRPTGTTHLERFDRRMGSDHDDRGLRARPTQVGQRGESVSLRHQQIEDDDVGTDRGRDLDTLFAVGRFVDDGTSALERGAEQQTNVRFVVTDEDAHSEPPATESTDNQVAAAVASSSARFFNSSTASAKPSAIDQTSGTSSRHAITPKST